MPKQTFYNLPKEKRETILDAALEAFANDAYSKVTVDQIVQRAGIPKGSFYQYFTNKEDIYRYLFATLTMEKGEVFEDIFDAMDSMDFSTFIRKLYMEGIGFEYRREAYEGLRDRFLKNCSKELREDILEEMIPQSNALFERVISHYKEAGELRGDLDVMLSAEMMTALTVFMSNRLVSGKHERENVEDTFLKMIEILEKGLKY